MTFRLPRLVAGLLCTALLGACGAAQGEGRGDAGDAATLKVGAAFYPLEYLVAQVGGEHVQVQALTKPGAEPHDVELSPRQVGGVAQSDLVVYERGFQPAVDSAVDGEAADHSLDVSRSARLDLVAVEEDHGGGTREEHADHARAGTADPHFWLDPVRYADVGDAVAAALTARDQAHAAAYQQNAKAFRARMVALDEEFRAGLASCRVTDLVTSHAAFGYLAEAYGLRQESISGLTPESEPSPGTLAAVSRHVRATGATTIYAETLVSQDVAQTLSRESGARLAVLDPIEGITTASKGKDYPSVMRANLATLRAGQECA